jgi:hypothetical protein
MIMTNEPVIDGEEMGLGIHFIRGRRVMLDSDLARIYGVQTKRLKEQFKRNRNRFPEDFAFQLERQELANLRPQIATSSLHGGTRYLPIMFTRQEIGFHVREQSLRYRTRNGK